MEGIALLGLAAMTVGSSVPALAQDEVNSSDPADPEAEDQEPEGLTPQQSPNLEGVPEEADPDAYTPPPPAATREALAAGNFTAEPNGENAFHISTTGSTFTSREEIELYLAYRAAQLTIDRRMAQFLFVENRQPGDTLPEAMPDPVLRFSFRLENFLPTWTYIDPAGQTQTWRAYTEAPFPDELLEQASSFTVSADIKIAPGPVTGTNPLAFESYALSDYLVNQVAPPQ